MIPAVTRKEIAFACRGAIIGLVLLSWWIAPEISARNEARVRDIESENVELRDRNRVLERQVRELRDLYVGGSSG